MRRHTAWTIEDARAVLRDLGRAPDAVLPMLHALQARFGFIHAEAIALVAEAVNRSRAEIHGVVTFYHDFRTAPPPDRVIQLCRAEACQAVGSEALAAQAGDAAEAIYCLGNCALGPAALVDGVLVAHLDEARLRALIAGSDPETLLEPRP
jgi:formate dehydrogenase subunit gamma